MHVPHTWRRLAIASAALLAMQPAFSATSTWSQLTDGFWDVVGNWFPQAPGAGDDVVIAPAGTTGVTVTFRGGVAEVASLQAQASKLVVNGGALRLNATSSIQDLGIRDGVLGGSGTVTVQSLNWLGGQMGHQDHPGGVTTVTGATFIDGAGYQTLAHGRTLNLQGRSVWGVGDGAIWMESYASGTAFNVNANATFSDLGAASESGLKTLGYAFGNSFNNAGTFIRSGLGQTGIAADFNNTGSVQLNGGTLLTTGGVSTGTIDVAPDASMYFGGLFRVNGGSFNNNGTVVVNATSLVFSPESTYSGQGAIAVLGGGRIYLDQSFQAKSLELVSSDIRVQGDVTIGTLKWGGSISGGGTVTVLGTTIVDPYGGGAIGTVNLNGGVAWAPGQGRISVVGDLNIGAGTTFADAGALNAASTKNIMVSGTLHNAGSYQRNGLGTTRIEGAFTNTGSVHVNQGTFEVDTTGGRILEPGAALGGGSTGHVRVAQGATLNFLGGSFDFTSGTLTNDGTLSLNGLGVPVVTIGANTSYLGSGEIHIAGGRLITARGVALAPTSMLLSAGTGQFDGSVTTSHLRMVNGGLDGGGTVTVDRLDWLSGQMLDQGGAGGRTIVNGNAFFDGTSIQRLGRVIDLNGDVSWGTGNGWIDTSAGGTSNGVINIGARSTFNDVGTGNPVFTKTIGGFGRGVVNNAGIYNRDGLGATAMGRLANTGVVNVRGGALQLTDGGESAGTVNVSAGATLASKSGLFSVTGGVVNNTGTLAVAGGVLKTSGGTINNNGLLTIGAAGRLDLASGADYAGDGSLRIAAGGVLNVQTGTLLANAAFVNGGLVNVAQTATLKSSTSQFVNDGKLQGHGTIETVDAQSALVNRGTLAPGGDVQAGRLSVTGNLILTASSVLSVDVGQLGHDMDILAITGDFTAGGALLLSGLDDFSPVVGDEFVIATYGEYTEGTSFRTVNWVNKPYQFSVTYGANDLRVRVTSVPELNAFSLMMIGIAGVSAVVHRRRKASAETT